MKLGPIVSMIVCRCGAEFGAHGTVAEIAAQNAAWDAEHVKVCQSRKEQQP